MGFELKTLCPHCAVGCGMIACTDRTHLRKLRGDPTHPANFGRLCLRGLEIATDFANAARPRYAMMREKPSDETMAVSSSRAIAQAGKRLGQVLQKSGPQAIAFHLAGDLTNETYYLVNKFAKGSLRTNHIHTDGLGHGIVTRVLGSEGAPGCYDDIELADAFLILGAELAATHPIVAERIATRLENSAAKCIVICDKGDGSPGHAAQRLAVRAGSQALLLQGLLRAILDLKRIDLSYIDQHTEGWTALHASLEQFSLPNVARTCGIEVGEILFAARTLAEAPRWLSFWNTSRGEACVSAALNLHLATGTIGKPGCGPFPLPATSNALGAADAGSAGDALPGQRMLADPEHRRQTENLWGLRHGTIEPTPGYDGQRLYEAVDRGLIRALWIIGGDGNSRFDDPVFRRALSRLDLVIVQDARTPHPAPEYAEVVFPAAFHLEQAGTYTSAERRVTLMEQAVPPPGEVKPDWWWVQQVALHMGLRSGLIFASADQIFEEFARTTGGRPDDQSRLTYSYLRAHGSEQWPCPAVGDAAARRYTNGQFPTRSGKARLLPARPVGHHGEPHAMPTSAKPTVVVPHPVPQVKAVLPPSVAITPTPPIDPPPMFKAFV